MAEKLQQQQQQPEAEAEEDLSPPVPRSDGCEATTSGEEATAKKEEEEQQEPKRRKKCPTALEEFRPQSDSNQSFSFTFDTKLGGPNSQFTPKFGSFNLDNHLIQERIADAEINGGSVEDRIA